MGQNYTKAIKAIINFKNIFDDINPKTPRKLVGEIGEFYALKELEKQGFEPEHKGGQGGYDIFLRKLNKRVEVRTSLLKNEGLYSNKSIRFWGWRVENRNQKKSEKFDYLIGVALSDNFAEPKFYIFSYKEAFRVDDTIVGRFNNIKKKIHLFENKKFFSEALKSRQKNLVTRYERKINKNQSLFLNKWDKIK